MEEIVFDKEARDKIINGITKMAKAVGSTMGPNGKTVIIPDKNNHGKYIITKDGVSVARTIFFKDPLENIGAQMLKEVAELTVLLAGDGTTTATVLAAAFVNNLKDFDSNEINKTFDEIIPKVIEQLKLNSKELKREEIKYVASISANNDIQIGELIQQAYNHSDIVKIEQSNNSEDKLELIDGMFLNTTYLSKHFQTNIGKGICELDSPEVIIIDGKLENLKPFQNTINRIAQENKSLLIITEHVHENVLRILETHVLSGNLKLCIIKSPGFSKHRKDLLNDIAKFTGTLVIKDQLKPFVTGKLKSFKADFKTSVLLKDDSINVDEFINSLKEFKSTDLEEYDKELLEQRINNLTGKVSIIKVGGGSELEMKERYDRYDDAVRAVDCALEEGIVEGGGIALSRIENKFRQMYGFENTYDGILKSLLSPSDTIVLNGNKIPNFKKDMFNQNIIDPLKVTRTALENAVSVAKTILSTNAVVLNREQWES